MTIYIIEDYKNRYSDYKSTELTDCCIRICLDKYFNSCSMPLDPDDLIIERDRHGKPFVLKANGETVVDISVSHNENTLACYVGNGNAGLDIQYRRDVNIAGIVRRYYSDYEAADVQENGQNAFYKVWTRKEAYAKYTGKGIGQIFDGTDVVYNQDLDYENIRFYEQVINDDLFMCLCMKDTEEEITIEYITEEQA